MRNLNAPPMMLGMLRAMGREIPEEDMREWLVRVSCAMLSIYGGADPATALSMESLLAPDIDRIIATLDERKGTLLSVVSDTPEISS